LCALIGYHCTKNSHKMC